jgi:ABC-type transport system involved in cytochrome c biogenesis permease component
MRKAKNVVWGVFLIAFGALLLLENLGGLDLHGGSLWPLVLFALAASKVVEGRIGAAVTFTLLGTVFFAITMNLYGLTYRNSWPLLIVAVGIGMIVRALLGDVRSVRLGGGTNHE